VKKRRRRSKARYEPLAATSADTAGNRPYLLMTVAMIREPQQQKVVEVAFSESARFYTVLRANPKFESILAELRDAKKEHRAVRVLLDAPQSNTISDVDRWA
jgi:hypothetical protein